MADDEAARAKRALEIVAQLAPSMSARYRGAESDARSAGHEEAAVAVRLWNGEGDFAKFAQQRIAWAMSRALRKEWRAQGRAGAFAAASRAALESAGLGVTADQSAASPPSETYREAMVRAAKTAAMGALVRSVADADTPDSGADVERALERQRVRDAVAELDEAERELLARYYIEQQSYAEIAVAVGKSSSTVHRHVEAIVRRLRRFL